ncbi:MAG: aminoacyl-tRNA hydrolase [Cyclobacteriaceae bacterium]|nr:aminoacyl-tRNA hydrolase [Cyclobacteriaceae bacterium]
MKYLIAGLGNIGLEYETTRHNIGFMVLDHLAKEEKITFALERHAHHAELRHKGRVIHLIKPTTYMNLSGKALKYWMQQLSISVENTLTITDDIALPLGKIRMKAKGSSAGHNGLKSIEDMLGTQSYPRLRFGIGDNFPKGRQVDYVLGRFTEPEWRELPPLIEKSCEMVRSFCAIGIERTMNYFNS